MKQLAIVFHSQTGNTEKLAMAAERGARRESGVEVVCRWARDAGLDTLVAADALLLGTPENFGYMSGMMKDFLDRTYYPAQGKLTRALPYALFISAGNDGTGAVAAIDRIAKGYPLHKVCEPVIARGDLHAEHLGACEELGQTLAAGLALGVF